MSELREQIDQAASYIEGRLGFTPSPCVGIILGTGLGLLADMIDVRAQISYQDIPHFPKPTVDTHLGELVFGTLAGKSVMAMAGRFHCYEGYSMRQVTFPVRVAKALGIQVLIVSNAAGGLNPQFAAGDLMLITDHINMMGDNPLVGPNDDALGPRFPDMSEPYAKSLIKLAETTALAQGSKLQRGVYLACPGPNLETGAEYRFMRMIGADAVGMSTAPEVIVAVHAGIKVLGFSAITDECFPDALKPADVPKIIATAKAIEPTLTQLLVSIIEKLEV